MATTFDLSIQISDFTTISKARKALLLLIANAISADVIADKAVQLLFICTHNSRRSQLAEVLTDLLAKHYGLDISAFSGGTEATAFAPEMIQAINAFGIQIIAEDDSDNPKYLVNELGEKTYFSKVYDEECNPSTGFYALMVCNEADEACPAVQGAIHRFPLKYTDPKAADDTPEVAEVYKAKVLEVGTELNFLFHMLNKLRLNSTNRV